MSGSKGRLSLWRLPFWLVFGAGLIIYSLRGLGIASFLPGGVILGLLAIAIVLGILYGIDQTRRF
jgi:hypothetical protein